MTKKIKLGIGLGTLGLVAIGATTAVILIMAKKSADNEYESRRQRLHDTINTMHLQVYKTQKENNTEVKDFEDFWVSFTQNETKNIDDFEVYFKQKSKEHEFDFKKDMTKKAFEIKKKELFDAINPFFKTIDPAWKTKTKVKEIK